MRTKEEIEKNREMVLARIKSENLIELYWHRGIANQALNMIKSRHEYALATGKPIDKEFVEDNSASKEAAWRETLAEIEKEIKIKEQVEEENGPRKHGT